MSWRFPGRHHRAGFIKRQRSVFRGVVGEQPCAVLQRFRGHIQNQRSILNSGKCIRLNSHQHVSFKSQRS